jgi:hypothetical protein
VAIVFTNSPRVLATLLCASVTIEARDTNNQRVTPSTPLALTLGVLSADGGALQADSGISFFSNSGCVGAPVSTANLTSAAPTALVTLRGTFAGPYTLTASAPPLTQGAQRIDFLQGPDTLAFTSAAPSGLRGGQCFPLTYQTRLGSVALAPPSNTVIMFSSTGGVRFYADPSCSVALTSQTLAGGQSIDTVYVRALSSTGTITASAPFDSDSVTFNALPIVRRGLCSFPAQVALDGGFDADGGALDGGFSQTNTITCPVTPGVGSPGNALLFIQGTSAQPGDHNDVLARCRVGPSGITCNRRQGAAALDVRWQLVELADLRVQALTSSSCFPPNVVTLPQAVDAGSAFVVRTLSATPTGFYDDEDALPFTLTSPTTVQAPATMCGGYDVQVAEWGGVTVTRGTVDGGFVAGAATTGLLGLPPAGPNRVVLVQAGLDMDGMANTCSLQARGAMPGPSELTFSRALGDAGCAVNALPRLTWERIDFGPRATVQERTVLLGPGTFQADTVITAVDPSRTFLLSSNQSTMGQGMGETDYQPFNKPAEAAFGFELPTSTTLRVLRGRASTSARVTVYVVQVE